MDMWTIVRDSSPVNQSILFLLIAVSVLSWGVVLERWRYFRTAKNADIDFHSPARQFGRDAGPPDRGSQAQISSGEGVSGV